MNNTRFKLPSKYVFLLFSIGYEVLYLTFLILIFKKTKQSLNNSEMSNVLKSGKY